VLLRVVTRSHMVPNNAILPEVSRLSKIKSRETRQSLSLSPEQVDESASNNSFSRPNREESSRLAMTVVRARAQVSSVNPEQMKHSAEEIISEVWPTALCLAWKSFS